MLHRTRWLVIAAAPTLLALSACGSDTSVLQVQETPVGAFVLRSIDGAPPPVTVYEVPSYRVEITAGSLTLNADASCSGSLTYRTTQGTDVSSEKQTDTCTWTQTNNAIHIVWSDGTTDAGSWSGDTISATSQGFVYVFER